MPARSSHCSIAVTAISGVRGRARDIIEDEALTVASLDEGDLRRMKTLMRKYRDLPMDFADAALVRIAERDRLTRILTFDHHFRVYALPGRARFVVVPPKA